MSSISAITSSWTPASVSAVMQHHKSELNNVTTYEMQFVGKQVRLPELFNGIMAPTLVMISRPGAKLNTDLYRSGDGERLPPS